MRAPVSRSRPLFSPGAPACWSCDHPLVGGLGLAGEFALGVAHQLVGGPDPGGAPGVLRGAGGDLQAAELLAGQRGLLVGVVLCSG